MFDVSLPFERLHVHGRLLVGPLQCLPGSFVGSLGGVHPAPYQLVLVQPVGPEAKEGGKALQDDLLAF